MTLEKIEKLILHRGYKGKHLENSKLAFENAIREGMSFETDIRVSKDGVIYLIHDDTLERLFNGLGRVKDLDSEELAKFSYKNYSNQRLCSLKEMCGLARQMNYKNLIFIHIKELGDIDKVIGFLEKENYNFKEIVRFFAVDEITLDLIKKIKKDYLKYKVGLHFNDNSKINEEEFKIADFIWADEINKENITKELVDFSHRLDKPIYVISPDLIAESIFNNDIKGRWREFVEMNVNGICTDKPIELMNFLKKR